jgi:SAM-dependent methyltransferase
MYGVLSVQGRGKAHSNPWTTSDFYDQAVPEFATNLRHWEQYGLINDSCVEVGCGAGRMTRRLQTVFRAVHACDVSPGMLSLVREHCDPAVVRTYLNDGCHLPIVDESVTAAYSTIVFQHFDSPATGLAYFREFYRVLKGGGTFMINLPWHQYPNATIQWPYRAADLAARGYDRVWQNLKRLVIGLGPKVMSTRIGTRLGAFMGNTSYDFRELVTQLERIGFCDIEVRCYYVPVEQRHHPFVFGRKPIPSVAL